MLYTDGLTEILDEGGEELGDEGLLKMLDRTDDQPLDGLVDHVFERVRELAGPSAQIDDQTLMLLRRKA